MKSQGILLYEVCGNPVKVDRSRQLMKINVINLGQGHFLTLYSNIFSETAWPIKAKFYMKNL